MEGKRIIVTTDLSENAQPAARFAAKLARGVDAEVEVMHVFNLTGGGGREKIRIFRDPQLRENARQRVEDWYREVTESTPDAVNLDAGEPAAMILERGAADDVFCQVIGMSGRGAWNRMIFGSTALKVAGRPAALTAVVHPTVHQVRQGVTIAVGTDFSDSSGRALERAAWFARQFEASSLHLVHVNVLPSRTVIHEGELPPVWPARR